MNFTYKAVLIIFVLIIPFFLGSCKILPKKYNAERDICFEIVSRNEKRKKDFEEKKQEYKEGKINISEYMTFLENTVIDQDMFEVGLKLEYKF